MYGAIHDRSPPLEETRLPRGVCRFILLHPEVTGQRCSCQGYSLNTSSMGSSCECGHQACYHVPEQENGSVARRELNAIVARVVSLEHQLERERNERTAIVHERIIAMEEVMDNYKAEQEENTKSFYRAMAGAYNTIRHYQANNSKRFLEFDDKIDSVVDKTFAFGDDLHSVQKHVGRIEDTLISLEERLEDIESDDDYGRTESGRPRKRIKTSPQEQSPSTTPKPCIDDVETNALKEVPDTLDHTSSCETEKDLRPLTADEAAQSKTPPPSDFPPQDTPELSQSIGQSDNTTLTENVQPFRLPPIPRASSQTPAIKQPSSEPDLPPAVPPSPSLTPVDHATSRSPSLPKRKSDLPSPPASVSLTLDDFNIDSSDISPLPPPPPQPQPHLATTSATSPQPPQSISSTGSPRSFKRSTVCRTAPGVGCQGMCEGQSRRGVV